MKSLYKLLIGIFALRVIAIIIFVSSLSASIDLSKTTKVFIEIEESSKMKAAYIQIDDEHLTTLLANLSSTLTKDYPSCPFGPVKLIFKSEKKDIVLVPAGDGCNIMKKYDGISEYYMNINKDDYQVIKKLLTEYGVLFPFGI